MQESKLIEKIAITYCLVSVGFAAGTLYLVATVGLFSVQILLLFSFWYLIGFIVLSVVFYIGNRDLGRESTQLTQFQLGLRKVALIYGLTFGACIVGILWGFINS
jgi:hypothetical protein